MRLRYFGRRVLVAGGSCDLALSLAELLISEGLFPILTRRTESGERKIRMRLQEMDGRFQTAPLDLSVPATLESLFSHLGNELDYLVDFAHGNLEALVGSPGPKDIEPYFAANVTARAELLRGASRIMLRKRRGRMVYVSSTAAVRPNPGQGFYAAAKLASEALYRNVGIELACRGITTVSLCPGYVDGGRGRDFLSRSRIVRIEEIPLGRALTCTEVAEAILYLLSDNAIGFNAVAIMMDGGLTAGK